MTSTITKESNNESAGSEVIHLLTDKEANQFKEPLEFDPIVGDETSWEPQEIMRQYLEISFDWNMSENECKRILSEFPVP